LGFSHRFSIALSKACSTVRSKSAKISLWNFFNRKCMLKIQYWVLWIQEAIQ
jgi:hypothetical protein